MAKISDTGKTYNILGDYVRSTGEDGVFIKVGFDKEGDNSAEVEMAIYKYLRRLLFEHRTPNVMRLVASFKCDNFLNFLEEKGFATTTFPRVVKRSTFPHESYYIDMVRNIEAIADGDEDVNPNKANISVIEFGKGKTFRGLLEETLTPFEFKSIAFQTFYTLRELYLNKVRHNDIHNINIWINILPVPVKLIYFVDDDTYVIIETKYLVKIYDFDRATFTIGPLENTALPLFCKEYGICSNENELFDYLIVLSDIRIWQGKYPFMRQFVDAVVINKDLLKPKSYNFPGRWCDRLPDRSCNPNGIIKKGDIYNIEEMCKLTDVFKGMVHSLATTKIIREELIFDNMYVSTACSRTYPEMVNYLSSRI